MTVEKIASLPIEQARSFVFDVLVANGSTFSIAEAIVGAMAPKAIAEFVRKSCFARILVVD